VKYITVNICEMHINDSILNPVTWFCFMTLSIHYFIIVNM